MLGLLSILTVGFFLGMRHATDPDHVIAVSTIVSRHRSMQQAALIGAIWGVGHTITIFAVGSGIILFGWVIPARLGLSMELTVGLMLILLGALNLTGMLDWLTRNFAHARSHHHGSETRPHAPADNSLRKLDRKFGRLGIYHIIRPLIVGLVHGLAGSAAVALLVLATIGNAKWAVVYLLVFGAGTIAGMMLITGAIGAPLAYRRGEIPWLGRGLRTVSGVISVAFGFFLVYQIGFVNGLFTGHPHWTPS